MNRIHHIRRLIRVLAGLAGALVTVGVAAPAAFAKMLPDGGPPYGTGSAAPLPATTIRVVTAGGMANWQIALIAAGAAILGALLAVLLDRARSARRLPATTAA
jgi:hypothetical protein